MKTGSIVTVLDIGSTKVCCCIASVAKDGRFAILGTGYCVCLGVKAGIITDIRLVERSIIKAVEIAENAADFRVKTVYVSISGENIKSKVISAGVNTENRVLKSENIERLLSMSKSEDENFDIIHAIPIMFTVDSQVGIKNPIGMIANNLKMYANIVSAPKSQINNIVMCLSKCHLELSGIVLSSYASGLCVCDESDSQLNNIIIDFGAGTTSVVFFYDGVFCGSEIIPIGGDNITNDIAFGLNTSRANAERIKALHGAAFVSIDEAKDNIFVPVLENENVIDLQQISKNALNSIIQSRVEEILGIVKEKIENSIFQKDFVNSSVIITGGGSQLTGMKDFSAKILKRKVILKCIGNHGVGSNLRVENDFSVAFGMIKFAQMTESETSKRSHSFNCNNKTGTWGKIRNWFKNS